MIFDLEGKILGVVSKADELPEAVKEACRRAYRVHQVRKVRAVHAEGDTITWEVETQEGPRVFESEDKSSSYVRLTGGAWVVRGKDSAYYRFPPTRELDEESWWAVEHYLQVAVPEMGDPTARE